MAVAELANRVVTINDSQIDYYASKGYTIYDDCGNEIKDTHVVVSTVSIVKYQEALDKIASLEAEIEKLKKAQKKETKKIEEKIEEKVEEPKVEAVEETKAEEKPKKTPAKKK